VPPQVTRRSILVALASAVLAEIGCAPAEGRPSQTPGQGPAAPPPPPLRAGKAILILGGTHFLGPPIVETARAHGHVLTLFNRGKTNSHLFPDVEQLHGDRAGDLAALRGRRWDAVIDTSGQIPRHVQRSATALREAGQYVFVSSISAYQPLAKSGADESAPLVPFTDLDDTRPENYGGHKALCERVAEEAMPGRVTVVRPTLIVGPGDDTDRFTYWPLRVARGGEMLAPGAPTDPTQIIDVRDLAEWLVLVVERGTTGVFNGLGPRERLGFGAMLDACAQAAGASPRITWADAQFLEQQGVSAWTDMPAWVPPAGEEGGLLQLSNARAVANGLRFRPLVDTARDTLAWFRMLPAERQAKLRAGLAPEREAAVLAAWHRR
jgi:2'-hydroxyisoflavone reductase